MKKLTIFFILLLFCFCVILSNEGAAQNQPDKKQIMVTVYPYYLIVKEISGNIMDVNVLVPPQASSCGHTYSPTPKDIVKLEKASLIVANGLELEHFIEKILEEKSSKTIYAADFCNKEYLKKINKPDNDEKEHDSKEDSAHTDEEKHESHEGHEHSNSDFNQHLWTDPIILIDICKGISKKLCEVAPEHKSVFEENTKKLIDKLTALDKKITEERKTFKNADIITYHAAFDYFFKRYGINLVEVFEPVPGKQITPKQIVSLGKKIKVNNVKAIYTEPQMDPKPAQIIAKEFGLQILSLDPMGNTFNKDSIAEVLSLNWEEMKKGFVK